MASRTSSKTAAAKPAALSKRQQQRIARALADPTRFEIFQQIASGRCVACSDVRESFAVTAPTISHHLRKLENAGLIETARAGKFINLTFCRDIWKAYVEELSRI